MFLKCGPISCIKPYLLTMVENGNVPQLQYNWLGSVMVSCEHGSLYHDLCDVVHSIQAIVMGRSELKQQCISSL